MADHKHNTRRDKYGEPIKGNDTTTRRTTTSNDDDQDPPIPANILVQTDGTVSLPFCAIVLGIVLAISGRWIKGLMVGTAGFLSASCSSAMDQLRDEDKQDIRYNIMDADDVVKEMMEWESVMVDSNINSDNEKEKEAIIDKARIHCIAGLEALAKKYGRQQMQSSVAAAVGKDVDGTTTTTKTQTPNTDQLALACLQAVYIAYRIFPIHNNNDNNDQAVAAALSLHALVAKNIQVRQCHLHQADVYGLDLPLQCMKASLQRAKQETNPSKEQQSAELQRKACLLLGALGDGDADVATQIVQEEGLARLLETMDWYRNHEDIANWSLWAVFILSYENPSNKITTVELGGVPIIVQALLRNHDMDNDNDNNNASASGACLEVARHGIAILFDLLREDKSPSPSNNQQQHQQLDVWRIRKSALAAGLHKAVLQTMESFFSVMDIMMMGQEILAGTDFRGEAPQYQPNSNE